MLVLYIQLSDYTCHIDIKERNNNAPSPTTASVTSTNISTATTIPATTTTPHYYSTGADYYCGIYCVIYMHH